MSAERDSEEMEFQANCLEAEADVQESILSDRRRRFAEENGVPLEFVSSEEDLQHLLDFIRRQP